MINKLVRAHNAINCLKISWFLIFSLMGFGFFCSAQAATFVLPEDNHSVVGEIQFVQVEQGETLLDIARRHSLGLDEIVAANPGVDTWLPEVGQQVLLPTRFVLPDAPRQGLVVNLPEMRLYYYPPPLQGEPAVVITYPLGIGAEGNAMPLMVTRITEKRVNPIWLVPESIRAEHEAKGEPLPKVVLPGPDNPLGDYALRLGGSSYLIHGTNQPFSIGMRVSHGCLRMYPEDIEQLYPLVAMDTLVRVVDQPYKAGWSDKALYVETHPPLSDSASAPQNSSTGLVMAIINQILDPLSEPLWDAAQQHAEQADGIPKPISQAAEGILRPRGWTIQVGIFQRRHSIEQLTTALVDMALPVLTINANGQNGCQIMVGPYNSRSQAEQTRQALKRSVNIEGIVIREERDWVMADCLAA